MEPILIPFNIRHGHSQHVIAEQYDTVGAASSLGRLNQMAICGDTSQMLIAEFVLAAPLAENGNA